MHPLGFTREAGGMKGPRYWIGFIFAMLAWAFACVNGWFLGLSAWLMDYEADLTQIRQEINTWHERQERGVKCGTCGR